MEMKMRKGRPGKYEVEPEARQGRQLASLSGDSEAALALA